GEDRDQRGHVDAEDSPCLDISRVVGADLVAHPVGEQTRIEGAYPAEEPDELGVYNLVGGRRWSEIQGTDRPVAPTVAVLAARAFEEVASLPDVAVRARAAYGGDGRADS